MKYFTDDLSEVWPGIDSEQARKVVRWLARAEGIIDARFPDLSGRVDRNEISRAVVGGVVEEMVGRALAADDRGGIRSEQLPEWQVEYDTGAGLGQGSTLYLTTDEYALLAPRSSGVRIGSMRMARSYEVHDPTP